MFKLCTFSTDQIKEFVGEVYLCIVGGDMDTGKGRKRKKQSQGNRKNIPQVTRTFRIIKKKL